MMDLHVTRQTFYAVANHVVNHPAHQGRHENHRPYTDDDRRDHDQRATMIAPQVAPGQR